MEYCENCGDSFASHNEYKKPYPSFIPGLACDKCECKDYLPASFGLSVALEKIEKLEQTLDKLKNPIK